MSRDDAIRSALRCIWKEVGPDIAPENKPAFFLTLYGVLEDAVESAVRQELGKRWELDVLLEVLPN